MGGVRKSLPPPLDSESKRYARHSLYALLVNHGRI